MERTLKGHYDTKFENIFGPFSHKILQTPAHFSPIVEENGKIKRTKLIAHPPKMGNGTGLITVPLQITGTLKECLKLI